MHDLKVRTFFFLCLCATCFVWTACSTPPRGAVLEVLPTHVDETRAGQAQRLFHQGNDLLGRESFKEAVERYTEALENDPMLRDAYQNRGIAWMKQGEFYRALHDFAAALEMGEESAELYYNLGNVYAQRGLFPMAAKSYKRAIELQPNHLGSINNLASAYTALGRVSEAIPLLEGAARMWPDQAHAYNVLAVALEQDHQALRAEACYRRAILVDPNHAPTHYNLASFLSGQRRTRDALESYNTFLRLTPRDTVLYRKISSRIGKMGASRALAHPAPTLPLCLDRPSKQSHAQHTRP